MGELKHNLFLCKLKTEEEKVVVKFVEEYGISVHRFMAEKGYAPVIKKYDIAIPCTGNGIH